MRSSGDESALRHLQEMIVDSGSLSDFLDGLTVLAAGNLGAVMGCPVDCSIALKRPKRPVAVGGSCPQAKLLGQTEVDLGEGPCLDALDSHQLVSADDTSHDQRWPHLAKALAMAGYASVLSVPLEAGPGADAALNFFAPNPAAFSPEATFAAASFASRAQTSLQLAVRIRAEQLLAEDLAAAMVNRSTIDMACGAIMAQNQCSQEEAFGILVRASNNRNEKLHAVAASFLRRLSKP